MDRGLCILVVGHTYPRLQTSKHLEVRNASWLTQSKEEEVGAWYVRATSLCGYGACTTSMLLVSSRKNLLSMECYTQHPHTHSHERINVDLGD